MWKLYYEDTTFSHEDGDPVDAPTFGVLVIAQPDFEVGRMLLSRFDWYWWDGEWYGSDWIGMVDAFMHREARALKAGRSVPNTVYQEVFQKAWDDPDLPVKSAWRGWEHA